MRPVPPWQSGLLAFGDTRSVVAVDLPGHKGPPAVAISQCGGPVLLYEPNPNAKADPQVLVLR